MSGIPRKLGSNPWDFSLETGELTEASVINRRDLLSITLFKVINIIQSWKGSRHGMVIILTWSV
jgi:hypothetical protein